jgi:hypothetical protein
MAEKEFEKSDPFEMVGISLPVHDPDAYYTDMARTFIEEYMMLGWDDDRIFSLFQDSFYQGTHMVLQKKGEAFVKNLIQEVKNG